MSTEQQAAGKTKNIVVKERFGFSHDMVTVVYYEPGEQEVPEDAADHALAQEKATLAKKSKG